MGEWPSGKSFLTMARLRPCSKSRAITSWCTICVPVDPKEWLIAKRTFRVSDPRSNRANTSGGCKRLFEGRFLERERGICGAESSSGAETFSLSAGCSIAMAEGLERERPFVLEKMRQTTQNLGRASRTRKPNK